MGSRKLVRDLFLAKQLLFPLQSRQVASSRLRLVSTNNGLLGSRRFSVFNEFSEKLKGEVKSNPDIQKSIKQLKEKAGEIKEAKEELKVRTKQTTEKLYKSVDGVWTEAEATAKKVSANVKEKFSAATEEVKETFGLGKQDSPGSSTKTSTNTGAHVKDEKNAPSGEATSQNSESGDSQQSYFNRFKSTVSSAAPTVSSAFQKIKETKVLDMAKQGYVIVKDELSGKPSKRRHMQHEASSYPKGERSTKTDIVIVPTKQSRWGKKWEAFKEKMQGNPVIKRISGIGEPVVKKSQELAEDVREVWETSDHPVVRELQDMNETVFGETDAAISRKEIRRRDPSFSLPDFVAEVQEMIRPTLDAYFKGDVETLKKNCSPEVIERCKAEKQAYESQGMFFSNKILHISDVEVHETKLMGNSPIIIVVFQTQQIYCVMDKEGSITEGGKDTIQTVFYQWAMQQVDVEDQEEGALYPIWRLRETQQLGMKALI
ncbi:mitochondrial import inner membrane translocase subunit TIM44-2-like [Papaver somniferum]|uniref:mitochondrial import inner membrane translocase subunit TIM44-2-like n=1 Tax=Papaver somniferum TaxID=3469 RepID=UPI000E6FF46D|nr:mitochondrial import inner membrane translocase subunit TIM44-2-like [Papaver somniferum]